MEAGISLNDCKKRCLSDANCKGIEYWDGYEKTCYECLNPMYTSSYTDRDDYGFPPSVFKKGITYREMYLVIEQI